MLTEISLQHFKCFTSLKLPLAPLTLLSGANATGKSSVLQALILLHQTLHFSQASADLTLNGYAIQLGTIGDVVDQISGRRNIVIGLKSKSFECSWTMESNDRRKSTFPIRNLIWREFPDWKQNLQLIESDTLLNNLLPVTLNESPHALSTVKSLSHLSYISANRSGPREVYPVPIDNLYPSVGVMGENTPWYLSVFDQKEVLPKLRYPGETSFYLRRQVDAWMQNIFPGVSIAVEQIPDTNLVKLLIRTSNATDFLRPQNVGYGITHILPIVTACLGASQGDLIIIENPESHLHPAAQSAVGEFLAIAASAGAQIILETHSDHILNGIRKAVKKRVIDPQNVLIHFFSQRQNREGNVEQISSPQIDRKGNIDYWPDSFFDQFEKDLQHLINWES